MIDIRSDPLDAAEVMRWVQHPGAGATVAFVGTVRDQNEGAPVTALEYEAYAAMARAEMSRIAEEIAAEQPDVRLAAVHRIGVLAVGDIAIVCAASAEHREQAFASCRALIDRIKQRVPVWKREHGPGGSGWVGWW